MEGNTVYVGALGGSSMAWCAAARQEAAASVFTNEKEREGERNTESKDSVWYDKRGENEGGKKRQKINQKNNK